MRNSQVTADGLLAQALSLQQAGELNKAEELFQKILRLSPKNTAALYSLAVICDQKKELGAALKYITMAIQNSQQFAPGFLARSIILGKLGRFQEAHSDITKALEIDPQLPGAFDQKSKLDATVSSAQLPSAPPIQSAFPDEIRHALALQGQGDMAAAQSLFESILARSPNDYICLYSLGFIENSQGRFPSALAYFERAVRADPSQSEGHYALGSAQQSLGLFEDALASFDTCIALNPKFRGGYMNKCTLLHTMNRQKEAILTLEAALAHMPDDTGLLNNKGYLLTEFREHAQAAQVFKRLITLDPDYESAQGLHAFARLHSCDWTDFEENRAGIIEGILAGKRVCNPLALMAMTDSARVHHACVKDFGQARFPQAPTRLWRGEKYLHRKRRVAFLSADFREHPVGYLLIGLIERLSAFQIETIGVSFGIRDQSSLYTRYRNAFDHYLDCADKSSLEVAQVLRAFEADIVVDLSGYTAGTRIDVLSHRPAPIQSTYLGFAGGLGLPYVDYIIADEGTIPTALENSYSERVIRLPHCYLPRDTSVVPAEHALSRAECGLPEKGFVFCSFNHDYKINPPVFSIWMGLLQDNPGSVLWLMKLNEAAQMNLRREAQARGVDPNRLVFATRVPRIEDHLARYRHADLCLDTFPYNGHTTASDVLFMGVPLVGLSGEGFASRVSGSLLKDAKLERYAATSLAEYDEFARALVREIQSSSRVPGSPRDNEQWFVADPVRQAEEFSEVLFSMKPTND